MGSLVPEDGLFGSISNSIWWTRASECMTSAYSLREGVGETQSKEQKPPPPAGQNKPPPEEVELVKPPEIMKITDKEMKPTQPTTPTPKRKPLLIRRLPGAGLQVDSVLKNRTDHLKEHYNLGRMLGDGQFGTTFLCVEKETGKEYACKSIAKRKLLTRDDVEDVRREIQIMHHLAGHSNIISIRGAYEDSVAVHLVMELCTGGELFDRIVWRGHYTERKAAQLARTIIGVVETCHSLGVMHRDLKPENFLFVNEQEDSPLKTIDFGLSVFFKPGNFILRTFSHLRIFKSYACYQFMVHFNCSSFEICYTN